MAIGRTLPHAVAGRRFRAVRVLRAISLAFLLIGALLMVTFAYGLWHGYSDQQQINRVWQQEVGTPYTGPVGPVGIDRKLQRPVNGVDFAIRVPKLHYFAAVREGVDSTSLYSGPGHYPGSVWPGDQGTVGVAAHNMYWINFPQLGPRDEVDLETRYGTFRYRVTGSRIVNPDDRTVLVPDDPGYHLVLTTCWPTWAGVFATQRYVIFTEQFSPRIVAPKYL